MLAQDNCDVLINNISEWDRSLTVRRCKAIQLDSGPANIHLYRRKIDNLIIEGGRFGTRVRSHGTSPAGHVTVVIVYNSGPFTRFNNIVAGRGDILFLGSEADYEAAGGLEFEFFGITVPIERFLSHLDVCHGVDPSLLLSQFNHLAGPSATASLCQWWNARRKLDPSVFAASGSAVEEAFLSAVGGSLGTTTPPTSLRPARRRALALAAEDYFLAHAASNPTIYSICKALGVPRRTLEYAFLETFSVSPLAYIHRLKLNEARRQLIMSRPERGAVKQVAYGCGFRNLGNFAIHYREFFGEVPTDTLYRGLENSEQL